MKSKQKAQSVNGVIYNPSKDKVLLIKRRDVNIWVLPGGGVEPGETPEEAVIRELYEETGLKVSVKKLLALFTPLNRLANDTYLFECEAHGGQLSSGNETKEIGFFFIEYFPQPSFLIHQQWLKETRQTAFPIQRSLSEITYFNLFKYFLFHPVQVMRILLSRCGVPLNF